MRTQPRDDLSEMDGPKKAKADPSILEHKAKREIELKVAEEQAKLEDQGCGRVGVRAPCPRLSKKALD